MSGMKGIPIRFECVALVAARLLRRFLEQATEMPWTPTASRLLDFSLIDTERGE